MIKPQIDSPITTIKVPRSLRERIAASAAEEGTTAAGLIAALLDQHERARRFAAVRRAYAADAMDGDYTETLSEWDAAASADLDRLDADGDTQR